MSVFVAIACTIFMFLRIFDRLTYRLIASAIAPWNKVIIGLLSLFLSLIFWVEEWSIWIFLCVIVVFWSIGLSFGYKKAEMRLREEINKKRAKAPVSRHVSFPRVNKKYKKAPILRHTSSARANNKQTENPFLYYTLFSLVIYGRLFSEVKRREDNLSESVASPDCIGFAESVISDVDSLCTEEQLLSLFSPEYIEKKVHKYCSRMVRSINKDYGHFLDIQSVSEVEEYIYQNGRRLAILQLCYACNPEDSTHLLENDLQFHLMRHSQSKKVAFFAQVVATSLCAGIVYWAEKRAQKLIEKSYIQNNEFCQIVKNLTTNLSSLQLMIEKVRPIYFEFYQDELGSITSEPIFVCAVSSLYYHFANCPAQESKPVWVFCRENEDVCTLEEADSYVREEMGRCISNHEACKKEVRIIQLICGSVPKDKPELLLGQLMRFSHYCSLYDTMCEVDKLDQKRQRYLSGDFRDEKNEQYSLERVQMGSQFEEFLVDLFARLGYDTVHTGRTGDQGADVLARMGGKTYAIQAKFYSNKLSNTPVQEVSASLSFYGADIGVVVTNSTFSKGANSIMSN